MILSNGRLLDEARLKALKRAGLAGISIRVDTLQAFSFVLDGRTLGYTDKRFAELLQICCHWGTGKYLSFLDKEQTRVHLPVLLAGVLVNAGLRAIVRAYLARALCKPWLLFAASTHQAVTVVSPPCFVRGKRDLCDACPDAILYQGELVPSCGLEEIRRYGKFALAGPAAAPGLWPDSAVEEGDPASFDAE